jgi:hypothetical protein
MYKMMSKQVAVNLGKSAIFVVFGVVAIRQSLSLPLLEPVCRRLSAILVVLVLICHNEYGYMYIQNDFDRQNVINRLLKSLLVRNDTILDTVALIFTTC